MSDKKVSAYIIRDFKDAGTEESFTAGTTLPISEGAFTNYEAAGLVRKPTTEERATKSDAKGAA